MVKNIVDYLLNTTAHYYQNTGTLDFSNYVTYGNITGTLKVKVIPEDINDSSLNSVHIYFKKLKIKLDDRPTLLSAFGGYSYKIDSHSYNLSKTYGYKKFTSKESFENAFYNLYINEVVPLLKKGLCASIYTQVSDVEDETNGLLTYDRKILKVDKEKCLEIAKKLHY